MRKIRAAVVGYGNIGQYVVCLLYTSFPAGVQLGVNTLKGYVNDMKYVFTKE